jgi:hypothetical protein
MPGDGGPAGGAGGLRADHLLPAPADAPGAAVRAGRRGSSPASGAPRHPPARAKRPRLGAPAPPGTIGVGSAGGANATCAGPAGKLRARHPSPNRAVGSSDGGSHRRQRPRLGAPVSPTAGPCSSATGPGSCQRLRVGANPPCAGSPRSPPTIRPGRPPPPRSGALQPLAEGPRSTSTTCLGGSRPPRTRAPLAIAEGPCSASTSRPGGGGLSPTSSKRTSTTLSASTTTKRTKLAPSMARHSRPYDYG